MIDLVQAVYLNFYKLFLSFKEAVCTLNSVKFKTSWVSFASKLNCKFLSDKNIRGASTTPMRMKTVRDNQDSSV